MSGPWNDPTQGQPEPNAGQPPYGQPPYGQPPYGQPPYGQPPPPSGRNRTPFFIGGGVVLLAVLAVVGYLVFAGGTNASASPKELAGKYFEATKNKDVAAADKISCDADNKKRDKADLDGITVTSYTVKETRTVDTTHSTVAVHVEYTEDGDQRSDDTSVPVTKTGSKWKVCFADAADGSGDQSGGSSSSAASTSTSAASTSNTESDEPTPSESTPTETPSTDDGTTSTSTDTGSSGLTGCLLDSTQSGAAIGFVVFAKLNQLDSAAQCALNGKLPAYTSKLVGNTFTISGGFSTDAPEFTNSTGTRIKVSVVKTANGYRVSDITEI